MPLNLMQRLSGRPAQMSAVEEAKSNRAGPTKSDGRASGGETRHVPRIEIGRHSLVIFVQAAVSKTVGASAARNGRCFVLSCSCGVVLGLCQQPRNTTAVDWQWQSRLAALFSHGGPV